MAAVTVARGRARCAAVTTIAVCRPFMNAANEASVTWAASAWLIDIGIAVKRDSSGTVWLTQDLSN